MLKVSVALSFTRVELFLLPNTVTSLVVHQYHSLSNMCLSCTNVDLFEYLVIPHPLDNIFIYSKFGKKKRII